VGIETGRWDKRGRRDRPIPLSRDGFAATYVCVGAKPWQVARTARASTCSSQTSLTESGARLHWSPWDS
jgi:hypothetical protein